MTIKMQEMIEMRHLHDFISFVSGRPTSESKIKCIKSNNNIHNIPELQQRSLKVLEKYSLKSLSWVRNLSQSSTTLGLDPVSSGPPLTN